MNNEPKRGPGRPRKAPEVVAESKLDEIVELATDLELPVKHSVEVQDGGKLAKITVEIVEYFTIDPCGRRKLVRRRK